jgi:hypothetical protein
MRMQFGGAADTVGVSDTTRIDKRNKFRSETFMRAWGWVGIIRSPGLVLDTIVQLGDDVPE